ncbi:hypothetical protein GOP47_0000754 [Adiantum capillus-veneris]|uniref:sterol 3beta-glucosyltransferase n=1 Tax=Adiantum capillus-veneris TaxID=13818 RepID=A0A9D4VDK6_ADICA|nr:hypothetical protein GOP47_0000754 [Adiantum capillus-veneris]
MQSQSPFHVEESDSERWLTDKRIDGCNGCNNVMYEGNCGGILERPFSDPSKNYSGRKLVEMSSIVEGKTDLEPNGEHHTKSALSRSPDGSSSSNEPVFTRKDSPSKGRSMQKGDDPGGAPFQLEPLKEVGPLEPALSAPPTVLMDTSPQCDPSFETSSPAPVVLALTDYGQSSSPGLQRAQTLPSGSLEVINGAGKRSRKADHTHTTGGKLSKRKQKKIMKKIATVNPNGTVEFDMNKSARFPDLFAPEVSDTDDDIFYDGDNEERRAIPPLQIAMLIVGTRGDVQPFVAIGKHLQEYGHRVRLATHSNFREFVLKAGLEFFPLGGDPKVLAGYMVKNKGFLPSGPSEIRTQRKQLKSIIYSLLPACIESDEADVAFKAQAIIANPPCYGHAHVAEALKVPLHIFFTMPWTPTSEFPHPLSRVHHSAANRLSYQVVDSLIWWGIRDIINDFRKKKLKLRPITYLSGSQPSMSKMPTGYIWSPHLVPKPKDWGSLIDVVGFCFLNTSQDYKPPESLVGWLKAGPAPVYVGFGSLPVEDPEGMTQIIVDALKQTCQRGIIDKGWGGIGALKDPSDSIYLLENCPHDWLFPQCAAVVHHGGAGTTAAGLRAACPTTIVPFFGDQPFWGDRVHAKGVGPTPIPVGQFSLDKLVHAMNFMRDPEVKQRAVELAHAMEHENGVIGAVNAFHKHLPREMPKRAQSISSKTMIDCITEFKIFQCFGA